jgi:hypothetical protein
VISVVLLWLAHVYDTPWQRGLLLDAGSAVGLFALLYIFQRTAFDRTVDEVEAAVEQSRRESDEALKDLTSQIHAVRDEVASALAVLSDAMQDWLDRTGAAERTSGAWIRARPTSQSTLALLMRALDMDAISDTGVRVAIPASKLHACFVPQPDDVAGGPSVEIRLEDAEGEDLGVVLWTQAKSAEEVFAQLATMQRRAASGQNDQSFDTGKIMTALVDAVDTAMNAIPDRAGASSNR